LGEGSIMHERCNVRLPQPRPPLWSPVARSARPGRGRRRSVTMSSGARRLP